MRFVQITMQQVNARSLLYFTAITGRRFNLKRRDSILTLELYYPFCCIYQMAILASCLWHLLILSSIAVFFFDVQHLPSKRFT